MSGYFTKLDAGITDSTVWREPDTTRLVWITLLSMADLNGYIGASVPGLADRARVSLDACLQALECFRAPDKWSRSQEFDGRRIADVEGGWVLLNHAKYRALRDAEVRKEQVKQAVARFRAKPKDDVITGNQSNPCKPVKAQADTEADTDTKDQKKRSPTGSRLSADWSLPFDWKQWAEQERPDLDILKQAASFADYWHGLAGAKGRKLDWQATWRNWIRNSRAGPGNSSAPPQKSKTLQGIETLERMKNGLVQNRNTNGLAETGFAGLGMDAADGSDRGNGRGMG